MLLKQLMHKSILIIITSIVLTLPSMVNADFSLPQVPKGKGDKCVEPVEEMRKNHMMKILHQRDTTVHEGVRTKKHSLKECINCHVAEDSTARYGDDKHFCSSCHNYAAVTIDCFQCHTDRPNKSVANVSDTPVNPEPNSLPQLTDTSVKGETQ